eukprot:3871746-Karenia_brevis.AAC.1
MSVSIKKSKVVASRACITEAILEAAVSSRVTAGSRAKLLGTDTVGGRRRCTVTFRQRVKAFSSTIGKYVALRKIGANSAQMVRTAGTPAIMYGCETFGVADSALALARSKVAKAASPEACGRNPELALLALDGERGTLDPAFLAHTSPIFYWALALWDVWFPPQVMSRVFDAARQRVDNAGKEVWHIVKGPATALLATIARIGWHMDSPSTITTDNGQFFDMCLDPPVAIAAAVAEGVRRWRWRSAGFILPGLVPSRTDCASGVGNESDTLV